MVKPVLRASHFLTRNNNSNGSGCLPIQHKKGSASLLFPLAISIMLFLYFIFLFLTEEPSGSAWSASQILSIPNVAPTSNSNSNSNNNIHGDSTSEYSEQYGVAIAKEPTVLVAIFSQDDELGNQQRKYYRSLFQQINQQQYDANADSKRRICSLHQYSITQQQQQQLQQQQQPIHHCDFLYTFIVAGHGVNETMIPTEIVNESRQPLLLDSIDNPHFLDVNDKDVTRLNIRENINHGKAQTAVYFASLVMKQYHDIDYYMKVGFDTALQMSDWFTFVQYDLPPSPFHRGVIGGALRDKAHWYLPTNRINAELQTQEQEERRISQQQELQLQLQPPPKARSEADMPRLESFWGNEFDGVHLYLASQLYFLSRDLVDFLVEEIPFSKIRLAPGGYLEQQEGHDIASMAFRSPTPLQVIGIAKSQRFWKTHINQPNQWEQMQIQLLSSSPADNTADTGEGSKV